MFIFDYIDPWIFMLSFGVGVLIVYVMRKEPRVVIKYPTPENAGKVTYVDDVGVCYKYQAHEVPCPEDKSKIKTVELAI